jgi:hypothetical protein
MRAASAFVAALLLPPSAAEAHSPGMSFGRYALSRGALSTELTFSRRELADTIAALDADRDGQLSEAELAAQRETLAATIVGAVRVQARPSGEACPGALLRLALVEGDGLELSARFTCPPGTTLVGIELGFLETLPPGHRHMVEARTGGSPLELVAYRRHAGFALSGAPEPVFGAGDALFLGAARAVGAACLALALGLVGGSPGGLLALGGALLFGLGLGTAVGAFGFLTPSADVMRVLGALALAYAGVESLLVAGAHDLAEARGRRRGWIAAPLGAVEGLAFASGAREALDAAGGGGAARAAFVAGAVLLAAGAVGIAAGGAAVLRGRRAARWASAAAAAAGVIAVWAR